jgi:hypothetical protein
MGLMMRFLACAKEEREAKGSEPGERMKMSGEVEFESA